MSTESPSKPTPSADPKPSAVAAPKAPPDAPQTSETETLSREDRALAVVKKYMLGNAVASLFPIPIVDLLATTGIQLAMVRSVAHVYDVPFRQEAVKEVVTTLITGLGTRMTALGFAYSVMKLIPGAGTAVGAVTLTVLTGAITYAVGKVFILHFEAGGNVLNLDAKKMRAYFNEQFNEGLEKAKTLAKEQNGASK